jgi:anti-sigma factor RsiW
VTDTTTEISCQELVELVTDYLEGALSAADRDRFDSHIAGCDGCRAYLEQIRVTVALTGQLTPEQIAPEAEAGLIEAFRDWKR